MAVRAFITAINHELSGLDIVYTVRTLYIGPEVTAVDPNRSFDSEIEEIVRTPEMSEQDCRALITQLIEEKATRLGYGPLDGKPKRIDAVFDKL
jgi:hypothetical protein